MASQCTIIVFPFILLSVVDATAKLQSGILRGNMINYGDFDECMSVKSGGYFEDEVVEGQYCLAQLSFTTGSEENIVRTVTFSKLCTIG